MGDDWRVCVGRGDLRKLMSEQALTGELIWRLGYQVKVSSDNSQVFWYADSAGSAYVIAQVAREVLAGHDVSAAVRTERWSRRDQDWRDVTEEPSASSPPSCRLSTNTVRNKSGKGRAGSAFPPGGCGSMCPHTAMW